MAERNLDFDRIVNRKNTGCLKYDFAVQRHMPEDVLPLWVADMDFETSSYIQDALVERTSHGIFGYSEALSGYYDALKGWMLRRHNWDIKEEWVIKTPGVVFALAQAVKAYTNEGDSVIIQAPVYYPFYEVIRDNGRVVVSSDLVLGEDNYYHMDLEDFEDKVVKNNVKLFLLCNPHNPVGRVWRADELKAVGQICLRHGVIVVSDEIHEDFALTRKHQVFADIDSSFAAITVTCTAPSKTFNIAGLLLSNIIISDAGLRRKFRHAVDAAGISQLGTLSLTACEAAYRYGDEWYEAMISYLKENVAYVRDYVEKNIPEVTMVNHEGTYLLWLDFRKTGLGVDELEDVIINRAKLWLDSGRIFGKCGEGFQRINAACPRSILTEALRRIQQALYHIN
ncbi:MAG: MalY/PatB family protein [Lachnospira sp.]